MSHSNLAVSALNAAETERIVYATDTSNAAAHEYIKNTTFYLSQCDI